MRPIPVPPAAGAQLSDVPKPPSSLGAVGKAEYRRVGLILFRKGTLRAESIALLEVYAGAFEQVRLAQNSIRREGISIQRPSGATVTNPACRVSATASATLDRASRALGLIGANKAASGPGEAKARLQQIRASLGRPA